MFTTRRLIIVATAVAVLSGCASPNPYGGQGQAQGQADSGSEGMSKTAKYGGLGALAGALAGAAINHDNRGKGALIGAAVVGASGVPRLSKRRPWGMRFGGVYRKVKATPDREWSYFRRARKEPERHGHWCVA